MLVLVKMHFMFLLLISPLENLCNIICDFYDFVIIKKKSRVGGFLVCFFFFFCFFNILNVYYQNTVFKFINLGSIL